MEYLRHAFSALFKGHEVVEIQNLGRVICTILNYSAEEQIHVNSDIQRCAPAIVSASSSSFGGITTQLSYYFSS
jgi:hypothetical protein